MSNGTTVKRALDITEYAAATKRKNKMESKTSIESTLKPRNIYSSLACVMRKMGAIGKDQRNKQQGWAFRGIDQVYNALNPLFAEYGILSVPMVLDRTQEYIETARGGRIKSVVCTVQYDFVAEDGSSISVVTYGEAMDTGDKATSKALAIAHKYALFQLFCIPTEETAKEDPDHYTYKLASPRPQAPSITVKDISDIIEQMTAGEVDARRALWAQLGVHDPKQLKSGVSVQTLQEWKKHLESLGA
jgi:hypothetical protein